jgi:uncharacterized protein (DUF302 family)
MSMAGYTLTVTCASPFDQTLSAVRARLAEAGFGVITEIDLSATLRQKIGAEIPAEVILGACIPRFAYQAITADPSVAALLPCNVVVRSLAAGSTVVEAFDPAAMAALADDHHAALADIAAQVRQRLRMALNAVAAPSAAEQTES